MKIKCIVFLAAFLCFAGSSNAQSPDYLWAKSANGTSRSGSWGCSTDASGNIIVTGAFYLPGITFGTMGLNSIGVGDLFIVKYGPSGNVLWAKSGGGTSNDVGNSCAADAHGNIVVAGYSESSIMTFGTTVLTNAGDNDMFIVKYDAGGNVLWAKSEGGTADDWGNSCYVDASGNIITTGYFSSDSISFGTTVLTNVNHRDVFTVKYDSSGNVLWARAAGGTGVDMGYSCNTDASENIIVTGYFSSPTITFGTTVLTNAGAGSYDMFIVKYDASGNVLWAKSAGGLSDEMGWSCTTDVSGNIIATGYFRGPTLTFGTSVLSNAGISDMFIVKYDSSGNVLWAKSEGGIDQDYGTSCTADASGNIIIGAYYASPSITVGTTVMTNAVASTADMLMIKYDSNGNVLWAKSAGGINNDVFYGCTTDINGNIIAAGTFWSPTITFGTTVITDPNGGWGHMFILKLDTAIVTGVDASFAGWQSGVSLNAADILIFPNPALEKFTVQSLGYAMKKVELFDLLGEKHLTLYPTFMDDKLSATIEISQLAPGMYFVKVLTEQGTVTLKMLKE